jgi:predicted RNase H-like HicB family nuclease
MKREFGVVMGRDAEGDCMGPVPRLRGYDTHAKSLDELMDRIRGAIELCLEPAV